MWVGPHNGWLSILKDILVWANSCTKEHLTHWEHSSTHQHIGHKPMQVSCVQGKDAGGLQQGQGSPSHCQDLNIEIENAWVQAKQHQCHVKYLTGCMLEMEGTPLDDSDLENLILEAGQHPVFEVPNNFSTISSELSIGHKYTEQLVSSDGMDI